MADGSINASNEPPLHVLEPPVPNNSGAGNVMTMAFSHDGDWLWSVSEDGMIRIWDVAGPECCLRQELSTKMRITAGALHTSSSGRLVVFVSDQHGRIRAWDLSKGKAVCEASIANDHQLTISSSLVLSSSSSSKSSIHSLTVAPNGQMLAAMDHAGRLHVWSITESLAPRSEGVTNDEEQDSEEDETSSLTSHSHDVSSISLKSLAWTQSHITYGIKCIFSPNSRHILTTSADGTAKLWRTPENDVAAGGGIELVQVYSGHSKWVWDGAFSADGMYIVTSASDNTARLWDAATGETIAVYTGHAKALTSVSLNDLPSL